MFDIDFIKNIEGYWYSFTKGISNLWKYKSIVWNDRDWDDYYMMKMLHFKLSSMRDYWVDSTHYIGSEEELKTLTQLCDDLKLLLDDDFADKYYREIDAKWGQLEMRETGRGSFELIREHETPENSEEIRQATLALMINEEKDKKEVKDRFFDTLKESYEKFWD